MTLSREEREIAQRILRGVELDGSGKPRSGCIHCTGIHDVVDGLPQHRQPCPRVKRAVWAGDELVEVEYWPENRWSRDDIVFPSEVFDDDEEETDEADD